MTRLARLLPADPGERALTLANLVNTTGTGVFIGVSAIFFSQSAGLSGGQVGLGLTVAGVFGLLAGVPAGHLADVRGPRNLLAALAIAEGAAVALYPLARGFAEFVVIASVVTTLDRSSLAVRNALIASIGAPERRTELRAYLRVVTNLGITIGAPLGGVALAFDTRPAYVTVVLFDAVTFVVAGLLVLRIPAVAPRPHQQGEPRLGVLRDRPFVAVTVAHAVLALHFTLLDVAVPLWVVRHTDAPKWVVGALLLVNTVTIVALQVRLTRPVVTPRDGAKALRLAGLLLLAACLVFAASGRGSATVAVALLVAATLVGAFGEMFQSAGGWAASYGLAPDRHVGQYQGFFSTGMAASSMAGPALLTALCVTWGPPGWVVAGLLFLGAGLVLTPLIGWAERSHAAADPLQA